MDRVERMHWQLLVERVYHPETAQLAASQIPTKGLSAKDRAQFHVARANAQQAIATLFPPDED